MIKNVVSNYKILITSIIICSLINFSFYLSTFENIGLQRLSIYFWHKTFQFNKRATIYLYKTNDKRLNPGYWFIVQFIPEL